MTARARLVTAALACLLPLGGCGDRSADESTARGSSGGSAGGADSRSGSVPGTSIPDDFPLSTGMGAPQDSIPTARTGTGLRDLELCGSSPLRGLGIRDRMVADDSGGEAADTRELVLLGSPDEAVAVAQELADLASTCEPAASSGRQVVQTRTEVVGSPFAPPPATTLVQTYVVDGAPGTGATVVHVVPVGAALLVASTYGGWTRAESPQAVHRTVEPLRETVSALGVFADGSIDPAAEPTEPTGAPTGSPDVSGPGSSVLEVTRVGAARGLVQTYGEGSLASLDERADAATRTTGKNPAMCVFTKTGC
ncbi:hypothetical protein [Nocardioides xinjiangensis]|uniref:hypothetical protein n=1 Tax=Nocardioides xinjiangensis TaxID=2817376 RepID=UPI001B300965|nr:hypothetical protein [Nocardioides sp. SYSU D00514]